MDDIPFLMVSNACVKIADDAERRRVLRLLQSAGIRVRPTAERAELICLDAEGFAALSLVEADAVRKAAGGRDKMILFYSKHDGEEQHFGVEQALYQYRGVPMATVVDYNARAQQLFRARSL